MVELMMTTNVKELKIIRLCQQCNNITAHISHEETNNYLYTGAADVGDKLIVS
jgi:hypothetical protein